MRPSRYFPKIVPTETMLDNLVYVINTMVENSEKSCTEGIGMIINMKQWKKNENYSTHYFYQLIQILQGAVPVRIRLCLILNAPKWFVKIWLFMKQMLTKELREKVIFLGSADLLHQYLQDGYEQYVPDELLLDENDTTTVVAISTKSTATGANTDDMVNDFIKYRKYVEMIRYGNPSNENQSNQKLATTDITTSHSTKRVWTESPIRVEALFAVPTGEQVEL